MLKAYDGTNQDNSILNANDNATGGLDEGYVYVKVLYRSYSGQTSPTGAAATATENIAFDFVQTSEEIAQSGGSTSLVPDGYYLFDTTGHSIGSTLNTSGLTLNEFPSGRNVAIKYIVSGNNITAAYACTKFEELTDPVCFRGGEAESYANNGGIITSVMALPEYSTSGVSCSGTECNNGQLSLQHDISGYTNAVDNSTGSYCSVESKNYAFCVSKKD